MTIQSTAALLAPRYGQTIIASHESAHAVISCMLVGGLGCLNLSITRDFDGPDDWHGVTRSLDFPPGGGLDPVSAWSEILVFYAGPAGSRHAEGLPLSADDVRQDYSAKWDEPMARQVAEYFWPADVVEDVLNVAAAHAAALVTRSDVWAAIRAVADYVSVRRHASVTEAEILIRRFVPDPIPAPGQDWALGLLA